MGFGAGFVTGLASSFDKALQLDMQRNQERLSKAETYMLARQQQKVEQAETDERELKKNLRELAALTGNNNRALMAAEGVGGTAEGIKELINDIKTNQKIMGADFKMSEFIDFTGEDQLGDMRSMNDLLRRFGPEVKPVSMPEGYGEATGLMGKLGFGLKRDVSEDVSVMAPVPERFMAERDTSVVAPAKFNYANTAAALEFSKKMKDKAPSGFEAAHMQLLQKMETAEGEDLAKLEKQQSDLIALEAKRKKAVKAATGDTSESSVFSKSSIDSVWKNAYKRTLEPSGVVKSVGDTIEYALEGNEAKYFEGTRQAISNVESVYSPLEDATMNRRIEAEKVTYNNDFDGYVNGLQADYTKAVQNNSNTDTIKFTPAMDTQAIINSRQQGQTEQQALREAARNGRFKTGEVIEIERDGVINYVVWTGTSFAGKY